VRLQPLYRATFTTPERWAVEVAGTYGTEVQDFLIAEGRTEGRLSARLRGSNYPRRRADGTLLPDFRGALDTDDGATILFSWHGYARPGAPDRREIVGSITHVTGNERYAWLNNTVYAMAGEVRPRKGGEDFEVVFDVAELIWEPLG
jgi:Protein of unknown function (DUF3237)